MKSRSIFALLAIVLSHEASAANLAVPSAFPTIQSAVTAAQFGDTITIAKGKYTEAVIVSSVSNITITGSGKVELRGSGLQPAVTITGGVTGVVLMNLRFKSTPSHAVRIDNAPGTRLDHCRFDKIGGNAIQIVATTGATIFSCQIDGTKDDAIMTDACDLTSVLGCTIKNAGHDGISLSVAAPSGITTNSTISGNSIAGSKEDGIDVRGDSNEISFNIVVEPFEDGIEIDNGSTGMLNTIHANTITKPGLVGIKLGGSQSTVTNNTITNSGGDSLQCRGTGGNDVESNTIKKPGIDGIWIQFGSDANSIVLNSVTSAKDDGIDVEASGNTIDQNNVQKSKKSGFEANETGNTVTNNTFKKSKQLDIHDTTGGANTYTNNTFVTSDLP